MTMKNWSWNSECDSRLREAFPLMTDRELAGLFGCSLYSIRYHVDKLGLKKSDKSLYYKEKVSDRHRVAAKERGMYIRPREYGHKQTEDTRRRIGEARKRLYDSEKRRLVYGLQQRTNIKVRY